MTSKTNEEYHDYIVYYKYEGKKYEARVRACSFDDAEKRVKAIGSSGKVMGGGKNGIYEIYVPAMPNVLKKTAKWLTSNILIITVIIYLTFADLSSIMYTLLE